MTKKVFFIFFFFAAVVFLPDRISAIHPLPGVLDPCDPNQTGPIRYNLDLDCVNNVISVNGNVVPEGQAVYLGTAFRMAFGVGYTNEFTGQQYTLFSSFTEADSLTGSFTSGSASVVQINTNYNPNFSAQETLIRVVSNPPPGGGGTGVSGPGGTYLDSITVRCGTGASTTLTGYLPSGTGVNSTTGEVSTNFAIPSSAVGEDCDIIYNFSEPSSAATTPDTSTFFGGYLTIMPSNISVPPGGTADYTVTFNRLNAYAGLVYFHLLPGHCPPTTTCSFPNGNNVNFGTNPSDNFRIFRIKTDATTPLARYSFTVSATQNAIYNSADQSVSDSASLNVESAFTSNHAQFVRYENVATTMNPGEVRQVRVVMRNDGTTTWTHNSGGNTCSSSPPNNGYYLHSHNPMNNSIWSISRVDLPLTNSAASYPTPIRYLNIQFNSLGGFTRAAIREIEIYDQNGQKIAITPAMVSGTYPLTQPAANAIDGDLTTAWEGIYPSASSGQIFKYIIDLGAVRSVSRFRVLSGGEQGLSFRAAYYSPDNISFNEAQYSYMANGEWYDKPPGFTPGQEAIFEFNMTAPTVPGTYPFQWRMHQECVEDFDNSSDLTYITVPDVAPTVDLRANGADTALINLNNPLILSWTTTNNPTSCTASGNWSGSKAPGGGNEDRTSDSATAGLKTYTLTCTNGTYSNSDTVRVEVVNIPLTCDPNVIGINRMIGCIWRWDAALPVDNPSPNNLDNRWEMHSVAPPTSSLSSPVPTIATALNFDWVGSGPNGLSDGFYGVWRGNFNFSAGNYIFTSGSDEGNTVYLDNTQILNDWGHHTFRTNSTVSTPVSGEVHELTFIYYENTDNARAILSWSNVTTPPPSPSNLGYANPCGTAIDLNWQDNSSNEDGFYVWRNVTPGGSPPTQVFYGTTYYRIGSNAANDNTYTDNPATGNFYSYVVTAYNTQGASGPSNATLLISNDECQANLLLSNKTISQVNGSAYTTQTIRNGDTVTFRIVINNSGSAPAFDLYLRDTLSSTLSYVPGSVRFNGSPISETISGQTITWNATQNLGDKANDGLNWVLTFNTRISSTSSQAIDFFQNRVTISYSNANGGQRDQSLPAQTPLTPFRTGIGRQPFIHEIAP